MNKKRKRKDKKIIITLIVTVLVIIGCGLISLNWVWGLLKEAAGSMLDGPVMINFVAFQDENENHYVHYTIYFHLIKKLS